MRVEQRRQVRRVVLTEVGVVLSLLRRNAKWASMHQNSLVGKLEKLRLKAREWREDEDDKWLRPLEVLMPFLEVVRSPEASGPFTGAALKALTCFLDASLLDLYDLCDHDANKKRQKKAVVATELVDAVINCRFEETDAQMDEVVKMRIIELLSSSLEGRMGMLLSDETVWEMVQTCFVNRNEIAHSRQLCHAAEQALFRMMRVVFGKTPLIVEASAATTTSSSRGDSVTASPTITPPVSSANLREAGVGGSLLSSTPEGSAAPNSSPGRLQNINVYQARMPPTAARPYGLPCAVKIFGFLCSQLLQGFHHQGVVGGAGHPYHASLRLICLRMIREALETAGADFKQCPPLMALVRDDLCLAILKMTRGGYTLEVLSEALGIMRCLWSTLRGYLKMQFEVIFKSIFLRCLFQIRQVYAPKETDEVAAAPVINTGNPLLGGTEKRYEYKPAEQQVILETLCDLLSESNLLPDLFYNYDCDTQRYDVLETLTKTLSDCASHLSAIDVEALSSSPGALSHALTCRTLCMDALLIILRQLYIRCDPSVLPPARRADTNNDSLPQALATGDLRTLPSGLSLNKISSETWSRKKLKRVLQRGAELFNDKPRKGLMYLMSEGVLQQLSPQAVANFLRTAPGLNNEAIGKYLGESGYPERDPQTGKETYVADTDVFHQATLKAFLATFHFEGQPILAALRMFLAAFRLPKEAQQIDRVLQAFANAAFESSLEAQSGLLVSADVAYLLSFSIIMLNTDLHNPNIRPEKRMSLEAFIKNNRNYGRDISKGKDLPDEFMESIYKSISEHPIVTFDDSPEGDMTVDRWRDLIKQAETDPKFGYLVVHDKDEAEEEVLEKIKVVIVGTQPHKDGASPLPAEVSMSFTLSEKGYLWLPRREVQAPPRPPLSSSSAVVRCGAYDREIIQWLWRPFLAVAVKSFVGYERDRDTSQAAPPFETDFLRQSVDMILLVAKITSFHGLQEVFDTLIYLLCGFTGLLSEPPLRATPDMPWDMQDDELDIIVADTKVLSHGVKKREKLLARLLYRFVNNPAARMALVSAFGIAHRLGDSIRSGWRPLLLLAFRLRDLKVLTKDVLKESEDFLTPEARQAFFQAVRLAMRPKRAGEGLENSPPRATGFLGGLLRNYLFMGGPSSADELDAALADSPEMEQWDDGAAGEREGEMVEDVLIMEQKPHQQEQQVQRPGGIEELLEGGEEAGDNNNQPQEGENGEGAVDMSQHCVKEAGTEEGPPAAGQDQHGMDGLPPSLYVKSIAHGRALVTEYVRPCKIQDLVAESRHICVDSLAHLVKILVACIHSNLPARKAGAPEAADAGRRASNGGAGEGTKEEAFVDDAVLASLSDEYIASIRKQIQLPGMSSASVAFAEVLLTEIALMNRDRISLLWPIISDHYRVRLSKCRTLSFPMEKVFTGVLRLCFRLFTREEMTEQLLDALALTLPPSLPQETAAAFGSLTGTGVWKLVTANLSYLTSLSLRGWKILFDAIQLCGPCGGEGTARSFEALCVLIKEPQLKSCVPITCVGAVGAFVHPTNAETLCWAAMDLFMVLHARINILVDNETGSPDVLAKCWSTILESLAQSAKDPRFSVRCYGLTLLTEALVDPQSQKVGALHVSRVLSEVAIPLVLFVCQVAAEKSPDGDHHHHHHHHRPGGRPRRASETIAASDRVVAINPTLIKTKELALVLVCRVFLQHLPSLLELPSFHELWLKVLEVMETFLGGEDPGSRDSDASSLSELALEQLKNMLLVMSASGAFQPGDDTIGKELWELTWAVIEKFRFCPNLKEELFGALEQSPQQPAEGAGVPEANDPASTPEAQVPDTSSEPQPEPAQDKVPEEQVAAVQADLVVAGEAPAVVSTA